MRNNRRIRTIAWIMAALMLLCAIPMSALGDNYFQVTNYVSGQFYINGNRKTDVHYSRDGQTILTSAELEKANRSQPFVMHLSVYEGKAEIPETAPFYYRLPVEVESATNGSNAQLSWTYDAANNTLAFTWTGKPTRSFDVQISVMLGDVYDLYNYAVIKINGKNTYYRLNKTKIKTGFPYTKIPSGEIVPQYEADEYDFTDTTVTVNGVEYVYISDFEEYIKDPKPYYTATLAGVTTDYYKIGGLDENKNPRWMLPAGETGYTDKNETGGFHRNYNITLHDAMVEQPLYNFIGSIGGKYYRLKKSTIVTAPIKTFKSGDRLKEGTYYIPEYYDFTNLVLTSNNKEYRYSPKVITEGQYENYYTIEKGELLAKNNMHGDANWYKNESGWLDGAKATFTEAELSNNSTWGFHQDYIVTFHDGNTTFYGIEMYDGEEKINYLRGAKDSTPELETPTKDGKIFDGWLTEDGQAYDLNTPLTGDIKLYASWTEGAPDVERSIDITANWPSDTPAYVGTRITLTAVLTGYDGLEIDKDYRLQWQYTTDRVNWNNIENANGTTYVFILDQVNTHYTWRVIEAE